MFTWNTDHSQYLDGWMADRRSMRELRSNEGFTKNSFFDLAFEL